MRTTLDSDADLPAAAKEPARREGPTAGQAVSRPPRRPLTGDVLPPAASGTATVRRAGVAGFEPFAGRPGVIVTDDQLKALRDAEGA